ncbi:hypothetical protein [Exiguobacterium sp. LL15]|uniref:hypothetical protein n=1 Tax=Exiguobacterium sp. LL15 TaxID=2950547 RepID=UPI002109B882|nr:hypothetical protein [Exiguobacterium sp. LL15]MCQ4090220.1 hypothetical protein [Exiguobacterium sp. LL15]
MKKRVLYARLLCSSISRHRIEESIKRRIRDMIEECVNVFRRTKTNDFVRFTCNWRLDSLPLIDVVVRRVATNLSSIAFGVSQSILKSGFG